MLLPEEDAEVFKSWVLPKLETISDADAEVLADYVIALVTTKDTDANIRHNCLESLSDFLQDNTAPFVDEVIGTLKSKSYAPRANANSNSNTTLKTEAPAPIPSIVGTSTSEYLPNPAHAFNTAPLHAPKGPAATRASNGQHRLRDRPTGASSGANAQQEHGQRSRKRKQNERDTSQSRDGHAGHDRPVKQTARRGGKNGRMGGLNAQAPAFAPTPTMPPFNPINAFGDVPPFDPTNPMALMAMAAAFGLQMPGMPPMPGSNGQEKSNIRCADYDTKGFCAAGSFCPYEHGLEYDQGQPAQALNGGRGRPSQGASSHSGRSGRTRASFSLLGPTRDRTNTTLVVEQIPEESFSEEHVRDFFGKFGTLTDVQMQAYKRLAIVKYETHEAANAAYNSPKAIFDNRFVKLYWHRSDMDLGPQNHHNGLEADGEEGSYGDTEMLDPEEIERRQAEAQRAFEERQKKAEEAAAKAEEIDRKLQETNAEILRVRRELAKASGDANGELEEDFSQDLATLQAEAENLFAQQDAAAEAWRGNTRGAYRGAYRARGYAPRARGSRGGYRGRGAPFGSRTGVKRLDNRPRRIAVKDVEPGSRKDEALRQHLFNAPDIVSTEQHPQRSDTLIITFGERYQAEAFIDTAHQIPDVGKLDMEWVSNDAFGGVKSADAEADGHDSDGESAASVKEENNAAAEEPIKTEDADMDVAEDEDQWL